MNTTLTDKTILVTGGTGSIGSEIVNQALTAGARKVIVFSRDEIKHFLMKKRIQDSRLSTVVGDIRDMRSLEYVYGKANIDIVYHAAAMKHVVMCEEFPSEAVKTNILGTQNVVDLAVEHNVKKMITINTDKSASPVCVMGASKFIAEKITLNANSVQPERQCFSCVRFGNVANSRGSVIPVYIDNLLHRKPLQVSNPDVTRFVMEIPDAVRLIMQSTQYARGGEVFILKMRAFRLGDLVDVITNRIAPRLGLTTRDVVINMSGLVEGEKLHEDLISGSECSRIYEFNDMYILMPHNQMEAQSWNNGLTRTNLCQYSSNDVELLSKDAIEEIAEKYLQKEVSGAFSSVRDRKYSLALL